jgi:ribonuclease-3
MTAAARRALESRIGHVFVDESLLLRALVHRSYCAEHAGETSNEQLEFLGDSVLGYVISDHVFHTYPALSEGQWSKVRASVVNTENLAEVAREVGVGECLFLGKGEAAAGGRDKGSILGDAMEAIFAAVYLDGGEEMARDVILGLLAERVARAATLPGSDDPKTSLQELALLRGIGLPRYRVQGEGPDHEKVFTAVVVLDGVDRGTGTGVSKKQAEQAAARVAAEWLREQGDTEPGTDAGAP